jgi:hypothetical protein
MRHHLSIDAVVDDALLVRLVRGANAADGARYILRRYGLQRLRLLSASLPPTV